MVVRRAWSRSYHAPAGPIRGVVLRTILPSDPFHPGRTPVLVNAGPPVRGKIPTQTVMRYQDDHLHDVLCDVMVYGSAIRSQVLHMVPVAQRWGRSDVWQSWIPRATSRSADGSAPIPTTDPRDLDGDHVLISFVEGDLAQPVIIGGLKHPRAQESQPGFASGDPASAYIVRHRGAVFRVDSTGNVTFDASSATNGALTATGDEVPGTGTGNVTIRTRDGALLSLIASGGAATRSVARVDDETESQFGVASNPLWDAFFSALAAAVDTIAGGGTHTANYNAARSAGMQGKITTGHDHVRTDE